MDEMQNPFEEVNQLIRSLKDHDERGLVLTLAAFAEQSLGELIATFMRPVGSTKRLLGGFNAPLGTLSSRIHCAYSLGLITDSQFRDLEHLRTIRNEFSHSWRPLSFDDHHIAGHIKGISYSTIDDKFPETAIEKVRSSLSFLLVELQVTIDTIQKRGRQAQLIGSELFSGVGGELDDQVATCRAKFKEIEAELATASDERLRFFEMLQKRWIAKFFFVIAKAPKEQQSSLERELLNSFGGPAEVLQVVKGEFGQKL